MEKKEENKYFQLGNMIRCVIQGSEQSGIQSYGQVNYIIYKRTQGTLPISQIFDNLIHHHKRTYKRSNKEKVLKFLEHLKTKFTEEELGLYPDYTIKDGNDHLSQKNDEMFTRGMLSNTNIYDFMDEMKEIDEELNDDK